MRDETSTQDPDTRVLRLSGREVTQIWDGLAWKTISDRKVGPAIRRNGTFPQTHGKAW